VKGAEAPLYEIQYDEVTGKYYYDNESVPEVDMDYEGEVRDNSAEL